MGKRNIPSSMIVPRSLHWKYDYYNGVKCSYTRSDVAYRVICSLMDSLKSCRLNAAAVNLFLRIVIQSRYFVIGWWSSMIVTIHTVFIL